MLVDTDVLIWYLRGHQKAQAYLQKQESFFISAVSYVELLQGVRNKQELHNIRKEMAQWPVKLMHIHEDISARATFYVEEYCLSHSLQLADALIASTAIIHGLSLVTGNAKHYQAIVDLEVRKFSP